MTQAVLPTTNNKIIVSSILAIVRAQRLAPGFDPVRATVLAAHMETAIAHDRTAEATFAICALHQKAIGNRDAAELRALLHG